MVEVEVRPVDPRDEPGVRRVLCDAFGSQAEYALVAALREDADAWIPDLSLGAYAEDELVGHVCFTRASVGGMPAVLLAPLAVTPVHQHHGIGSVLARAGLDGSRAQGAVIALVLGHPDYYPRFGFEAAHPHGILPPYEVEPEAAWMALALVPGALELARGTVSLSSALMDPAMWRE